MAVPVEAVLALLAVVVPAMVVLCAASALRLTLGWRGAMRCVGASTIACVTVVRCCCRLLYACCCCSAAALAEIASAWR